MLHLLACREKMFMVLASWRDVERRSTVVAGLLANQDAWKEFDQRSSNGSSEGKVLSLRFDALESAGVSAIVAIAEDLKPSNSRSDPNPYGRKLEPGLLCFEHCVLEGARRMQPAPPGQTVCFVMDWADALASSAIWHLEELMNISPSPGRERIGALGFENRESFLPLRMACLLARRCSLMPYGRGLPHDLHGLNCSFLVPHSHTP